MTGFCNQVFALLIVLSLCDVACGQWAADLETPWRTQISKEDLDGVVERLPLNTDQQQLLRQLYCDHVQAYKEIATEGVAIERKLNQAISNMLPKPGGEIEGQAAREQARLAMMRTVADFANRLTEMDAVFLINLELILVPEQLASWSEIRRAWTRRRLERFQEAAPGARVDLLEVLNELDLDADAHIILAHTMAEYEATMVPQWQMMLDGALAAAREEWRRFEIIYTANAAQRTALSPADWQAIGRKRFVQETHLLRRQLLPQVVARQINMTFSAMFVEQLPEAKQQIFLRQVMKRSHPHLGFERTQQYLWLARLRELPNLTEGQRIGIQQILADLVFGLQGVLEAAARADDELFTRGWATPLDVQIPKRRSDLITKTNEQYVRLSAEAAKLAYGLLNPDQKQQLQAPAWLNG